MGERDGPAPERILKPLQDALGSGAMGERGRPAPQNGRRQRRRRVSVASRLSRRSYRGTPQDERRDGNAVFA